MRAKAKKLEAKTEKLESIIEKFFSLWQNIGIGFLVNHAPSKRQLLTSYHLQGPSTVVWTKHLKSWTILQYLGCTQPLGCFARPQFLGTCQPYINGTSRGTFPLSICHSS